MFFLDPMGILLLKFISLFSQIKRLSMRRSLLPLYKYSYDKSAGPCMSHSPCGDCGSAWLSFRFDLRSLISSSDMRRRSFLDFLTGVRFAGRWWGILPELGRRPSSWDREPSSRNRSSTDLCSRDLPKNGRNVELKWWV